MQPDLELGKAVSLLMLQHKDHFPVDVASNSHVSEWSQGWNEQPRQP